MIPVISREVRCSFLRSQVSLIEETTRMCNTKTTRSQLPSTSIQNNNVGRSLFWVFDDFFRDGKDPKLITWKGPKIFSGVLRRRMSLIDRKGEVLGNVMGSRVH